MNDSRWLVYAVLSAVAAAAVPVFGKLGMERADATIATAVRSAVMTLFLLAVATAVGAWQHLAGLRGRAGWMVLLSGLAGATSWLFYFHAVKLGRVSQVAAVDKLSVPLAAVLAFALLRERPGLINWAGIALVVAGAYLAALPTRG